MWVKSRAVLGESRAGSACQVGQPDRLWVLEHLGGLVLGMCRDRAPRWEGTWCQERPGQWEPWKAMDVCGGVSESVSWQRFLVLLSGEPADVT